jgi:hypothetical protein
MALTQHVVVDVLVHVVVDGFLQRIFADGQKLRSCPWGFVIPPVLRVESRLPMAFIA